MKTNTKVRPLYVIANEIRQNWKPIHSDAVGYVEALECLNTIKDSYIMDGGREIVARFLNNARTWQGDKAREIKKELNAMLKDSYVSIS